MAEQGRKLMKVIGFAVSSLNAPATLVPAVEDLGRRHKGYGVQEKDYQTVASALLWRLERGLGDAFTPAVRAAWTETYTVLADTMKKAAA